MGRALIVLAYPTDRKRAHAWIEKAPVNTRLTFQAPKRTLPQNDALWAALTDVSIQVPWHGQKLTPDDWKSIFTAALKRELRMVPNLDGDGFVLLGASTSDMSRGELSDLLELIKAKGAEWGVVWSEPKSSELKRELEPAQ